MRSGPCPCCLRLGHTRSPLRTLRPAPLAAPAPAAVRETETPAEEPVEVEEGIIMAEHLGRRHVITSEDDVYQVKTFGRARPRRYRITVEGVPYEVEIR